MVQIKVKGINNTYHIIAAFDEVAPFLIELKERLKTLSINRHPFQAFFHLPPLSDEQLFQVFQICQETDTYLLGFDTPTLPSERKILEQDLYNGQTYCFHEPILLLGNIQKQAIVSTSADLYVMGCAYGSIDMLYEDCVLCASRLQGNVRICDTQFQNLTSFSPVKVYYDEGKLYMKTYEEERMWERQ